jgi:N-acetyl-D-muramate 6-phosphate phosphatase
VTSPVPRQHWHRAWSRHPRKAMLFDLDGTLLDTAPDLVGAVNLLRQEQDLPPLPVDDLRPYISQGARGMITQGMGIAEQDALFEPAKQRFLQIYAENLVLGTTFWPGMEAVVQRLEEKEIAWGIVTNKMMRFTEPLLKTLKLWDRCAVVVGGDTAPHAKPHPAPLQYAVNCLGLPQDAVTYVGDDLRDIQSGFTAGCWTIACDFDVLKNLPLPQDWGADAVIRSPAELLEKIS